MIQITSTLAHMARSLDSLMRRTAMRGAFTTRRFFTSRAEQAQQVQLVLGFTFEDFTSGFRV